MVKEDQSCRYTSEKSFKQDTFLLHVTKKGADKVKNYCFFWGNDSSQ